MVYVGYIVLYACTALTVIFLLAVAFHFYRTRVRVYLYFAVVFSSGLVAYALKIAAYRVVDSMFDTGPDQMIPDAELTRASSLSTRLSDASYIFELFSDLVFHLGILSLFGTWLVSMQASLPYGKRTDATAIIYSGSIVFGFTASTMIFETLLPGTWPTVPWFTIALCLEYAILVLLLIFIVWLLVGLIRSSALHRSKKNQLWILAALVVFSPPLQSFPVVMSAVIWLIPCVLVVWPGALVGFDKAPDAEYQHEAFAEKV